MTAATAREPQPGLYHWRAWSAEEKPKACLCLCVPGPTERQGAIDRGYPPRATARTDFGFYTPLFSGLRVELHKVQGLGMDLRLLMEELLSVLGRSCSNFEELCNNSK
jgi:hypothetical protein